ncbi:MAG TPA: leucine--tRNA ligase [Chloroflexota bacterium]|nr:leucine--tRNA ligase [Chloroflexota bacterium]
MTSVRGLDEAPATRASDRYDPRTIERHWQAVWARTRIYETDLHNAKRPFYNLMMFPYPSAQGLHVGNLYAYTGADIYGRFQSMRGYQVFEPMGFDAFGIHSENFAIKQRIHPRVLTAENVERFRETQLKRAGCRFDWSHEVITTDPRYYRWTQWIFVQLFKAGLAERRKAAVNWCPTDGTVLADEQVIDGRCERCETPVVLRELEQWFLRITAFADRLLANLDHLDWSENVKSAQRRWIGRSEGLQFGMPVVGQTDVQIDVFTTRPDTVFGVTYVVLAPEHPLVERVTTSEHAPDVEAYRTRTRARSELERQQAAHETSGVFTGAYAVNPANGEQVPIWIAEYVLASYGTGAIMAVPAHDARDWEFARAFGLPIRQVIAAADDAPLTSAYLGAGRLVDSGPFVDQPSDIAAERIVRWFEERGIGRRTVQFRLRDWLVSRQRYWGAPIPIIHCERCGSVPVPEDQLPVLLPDVADWLPREAGSSPLADVPAFVEAVCPTCDGAARRETDVADNFLDSAWYYLRYPSSSLDDRVFDPALTAKWLPVDMYIGGAEHAVLHLLYSRFITMALHDLGHLTFEEPFTRFRAHGLLVKDGAKMSKSRGNVVNPDGYFDRLGADTLRMYLVFVGPYEQGGMFSDRGIGGIRRFLGRVWDLVGRHAARLSAEPPPADACRALHRTIHQVTEDLGHLRYNTAIAALMGYLNTLQERDSLHDDEVAALLLMLAPFAPHLAEELWAQLPGKPFSIHQQPFPVASAALLEVTTVPVAVQINGRTRGLVHLAPQASEAEALAAARGVSVIAQALQQAAPRRVVYVPGRILNLVL